MFLVVISCTTEQFDEDLSGVLKEDATNKASVNIQNPGFESGEVSWGDGSNYAISGDSHSGSRSGKITSSSNKIEQTVNVSSNTNYVLTAWVEGNGKLSIGGQTNDFNTSSFEEVSVTFNSGNASSVTILGTRDSGDVRFDDFELNSTGGGGGTAEGNLALGKVAEQSSTAYSGSPERAVDGNTSGNWGDATITHTSKTASPWWQVRLGEEYAIGDIVIWNRTNCCSDRLSNFDVFVYNDAGQQVYKTTVTDTPSPYVTIDADGAVGSRVRIKLKGTNFLSLAEVQVFGNGDTPVTPPPPPTTGGGDYPYDFLGLTNWKITVPKDQSGNGKADEIYVDEDDNSYSGDPSFTEYDDPDYFSIEGNWVRFTCEAGSSSTIGSDNPRSELREMTSDGSDEIEWDMRSSTLRKLEVTVRITETPSSGKVCFAQIHGLEEYGFDDIIRLQIRSSGAQTSGASSTLYVMGDVVNDNADDIGSYTMGDEITMRIEAQNSTVRVYLNNTEVKEYNNINSPGNYFKAGNYLQSKPTSGKGVTEFKVIKTTPN
ncbi:hypothetical protein GCM10022393_26500 [Aquimarina addita]|uniref:F5/8 type C domain-containing protein n=2 Tax=Aquimarina addita TaxID=870485 RepID=A0ABP6UMS0_9FLAO